MRVAGAEHVQPAVDTKHSYRDDSLSCGYALFASLALNSEAWSLTWLTKHLICTKTIIICLACVLQLTLELQLDRRCTMHWLVPTDGSKIPAC